jgi:Zn-dependent peptidase ImmA (M78 family)
MSGITWRYQAGDTSEFALQLQLSHDDDTDDHMIAADERESWGAFSIWVRGVNLCAHLEGGEDSQAVHWYLLPLLEWIVDNWDPLLHEQRLPLGNDAAVAADALGRISHPPLLLPSGMDEFDWHETRRRWWARHNIREGDAGGVFPDIYLRRYGDMVEVSMGGTPGGPPPSDFDFYLGRQSWRVPADPVANALYRALTATSEELLRRRPESLRLARLRDRLSDLSTRGRYRGRLAWLSGHEPGSGFELLWRAVDAAFDDADAEQARLLWGERQSDELLLLPAPAPALLFGSANPTVTPEDAEVLAAALLQAGQDRGEEILKRLRDIEFPSVVGLGFTPGEEGSSLGEAAHKVLLTELENDEYVDVAALLRALGVRVDYIDLQDRGTRAICLLAKGLAPQILLNRNYRRGFDEPVLRFSMAHELGHLLLDRALAQALAIVSGPWAPIDVEQRANAFAAAFLMPTHLLLPAIQKEGGDPRDPGTVARVARRLRVSLTSLADRLRNLRLISHEEADDLKLGARIAWERLSQAGDDTRRMD